MTAHLEDLVGFRWPDGFELGATARVTRRGDTEGRIVGLDAPSTALDVGVVEIRTPDGTRVFATLRGVEIRGVDYAVPISQPRTRRPAAGADR